MNTIQKPVDLNLVRQMVAVGMRDVDIAKLCKCHVNTIRNRRKQIGLRRSQSRPRILGSCYREPKIFEPPLPHKWNTVHFTDISPALLEAETNRAGWYGLPWVEPLTHRGYGGTYSAVALDL